MQWKEEKIMFCKYCGKKVDEGSKFCNACGGDLMSDNANETSTDLVASSTEKHIDNGTVPYVKHWEFVTKVGGSGYAYTMVDVDGTAININKFNSYLFFKWGKKSASLDVRNIISVYQKKKIRPLIVMCLIASILGAMNSNGISIILAIVCLFQLFDKLIVIQHKNGTAKITDCTGSNTEIVEFFDYIRKYNPDSIRVNI